MAGKVISIEIGYSLTRVCETDYKAKIHRIYKNFSIPTPEGVINDGALMITPEYVESMKAALAENKMKSKQVVFTITSAKIASREVVIPFVKDNRIADVINANASDYFPVDLSQYQLAYSILGVLGETKGNQQYKLLVMAAPKALLSGYYDLAKALKLEVAALDYAGNSIYRVVKEECAQGTNLIIKSDERSTLVMVVQNGAISFTRNIAYGVDEAIQSVMDSLNWGQVDSVTKAMDILSQNICVVLPQETPEKQEKKETPDDLVIEEIADEPEKPVTATPEQRAKEDVTNSIMPLIGSIARVVDYYVSHNTNTTIDRVLFTGLGADIQGLNQLLAQEINHPVEVLTQAAGWNFEKSFKTKAYGAYLACAGATVAPLGFKANKEKAGAKPGRSKGKIDGAIIAYVVLGAGIVASLGMIVSSTFSYGSALKENIELRAQTSELEAIIPVYNEYVTTYNDYIKVSAMYDVTRSNNDNFYELLEELEQRLPSDVSVVSLESNRDGVAINMDVPSKNEAAAAVEQMRLFDSLYPDSVTVTSVTMTEEEETGSTTVNFTVTANYRSLTEQENPVDEADESTEAQQPSEDETQEVAE